MKRRLGSACGKCIGLALFTALLAATPGAAEEAGREVKSPTGLAPVRMNPDKLAGVDLPVEAPFIPPEDVLEGIHQPRGEVLYRGEELVLEIYEHGPVTFASAFSYDEYVLVLSGKLILTDAGGQVHEFTAGDSLVIPKGFTGTWKVLGNYRELVAIERAAYDRAYPTE